MVKIHYGHVLKLGVPQGYILGPVLFLVCISDFSDILASNLKLFAYNTFLFSVVRDIGSSAINSNSN